MNVYCLMHLRSHYCDYFFFFNDTATTEIYTLSLHDALPILRQRERVAELRRRLPKGATVQDYVFEEGPARLDAGDTRSEEHTSELQSQFHLVCRLLLEKKKQDKIIYI